MTDRSRSLINAELIGIAAVVLSLILVAMELRQNTIALEGQAVLDLNAAMAAQLDSYFEYPELREIFVKTRSGPEVDLTVDEQLLLNLQVNQLTASMEAAWVFHRFGLIDDEQLGTTGTASAQS